MGAINEKSVSAPRLSGTQREAIELISTTGYCAQDPSARHARSLGVRTIAALERLQMIELVEVAAGYWPDGTSRSRHVYVLTDAGRAALRGAE